MAQPPSQILEFVSYDPATGIFMWAKSPHPLCIAGTRADLSSPKGYMRVQFWGKSYLAHRLAVFFITGEWPAIQVDHRNRNRSDNRYDNLRRATSSQNQANCLGRGNLKKGVTRLPTGKFQAQIKSDGKNHYLGSFSNEADAHAAYASAATHFFGEFARMA